MMTWEQLPDFGLYMEQILPLLQQQIHTWTNEEDVLTASMINNYAKKNVIPRPEHKKYYRRHIALLTVVAFLKNTLTITEISVLLGTLGEDTQKIYHIFCQTLENSDTGVSSDGSPEALLEDAVQVNIRQLQLKKKIQEITPPTPKIKKEKKNGTQKK